MSVLPYLWLQGLFFALAAAGWVWGFEPARWAVHGFVWGVLLPVSFFCALSSNLQRGTAARAPCRPAVAIASRLTYLSVLAVLLWHGAWLTAAALALCIACMLAFGWQVAWLRARYLARYYRTTRN